MEDDGLRAQLESIGDVLAAIVLAIKSLENRVADLGAGEPAAAPADLLEDELRAERVEDRRAAFPASSSRSSEMRGIDLAPFFRRYRASTI